MRAKHQEPCCHATSQGDKLFTGSLCQGSAYGMQVMRSGSLAVKSHQRRRLGLSSVKLSLSTRRRPAGKPSMTNGTIFPYMYPSGRIHAIFVVLCFLVHFSRRSLSLWMRTTNGNIENEVKDMTSCQEDSRSKQPFILLAIVCAT